MKYFLILILSSTAQAQVNLDQPIAVGVSDKVFQSTNDPHLFYYLPIGLKRMGEVTTTYYSDYANARFKIGSALEDLKRVQDALAPTMKKPDQVRFFRPLAFEIQPGTDIPASFEPKLTALGDFDFAGELDFSLQVASSKSRWKHTSTSMILFDELFGDTHRDNVGIIRYTFSAFALGKPYLAQTAVALFTGENSQTDSQTDSNADHSHRLLIRPDVGFPSFERFAPDDDEKKACWNQVMPGKICIRSASGK